MRNKRCFDYPVPVGGWVVCVRTPTGSSITPIGIEVHRVPCIIPWDIDASDNQRNDAADLNAVTSDLPNAASAAPSGAAFAAEGNRRDNTSELAQMAEGTSTTGSGSIRIMLTRAEHEQLQQERSIHP